VRALLKHDLRKHHEKVRYADNLPEERATDSRQLKVAGILRTVNEFLAEHRRYMVVAESAICCSAGSTCAFPRRHVSGAGFYASMDLRSLPRSAPKWIGSQAIVYVATARLSETDGNLACAEAEHKSDRDPAISSATRPGSVRTHRHRAKVEVAELQPRYVSTSMSI